MELGLKNPVPSLDTPAIKHQLQQGFWCGAQAREEVVGGLKRLAVTAACRNQLHDPAGTDPGCTDVLRCLSGPQRSFQVMSRS